MAIDLLKAMDLFISAGEAIAPITPFKFDDLAVSLVKFLRNDANFLAWAQKFTPPAPGAMSDVPLELKEALRRWQDETGKAVTPGKWMELVQLVLQLLEWWSKNKPAQPAA